MGYETTNQITRERIHLRERPGPRVSGLRGVLRRQRLWAVTWQTVVGSPESLWFEWENPLEIHQKWRFLEF